MNILIVNEGCVIGGIETWMLSLWKALRERGHKVELFFFMHGPMEAQLPSDCVAYFGDLAALLRLVEAQCVDVVHVHSGDIAYGVTGVRAFGARLVVTSHGWVIPGWTSLNADAFVASSRWLAEEQRPLTDLPVRVIELGIDTTEFSPTAEEISPPPIVAWVGRGLALEQKRIDKLADVAPSLAQAGLRLWLAEASGVDAVRRVVPAVEAMRPVVERWRGVPRKEMADFFRGVAASGGVVLSTSSYEGLGLAYVEAQACGCPVIAPDVRGVNEAVRPEHGGVLYPFDLPAIELAALVIASVGNREAWSRRRDLGLRFVHGHFSVERMAEEYVNVYRDVLALRRRRFAGVGRWLRILREPHRYLRDNWSAAQALYEASGRLSRNGRRTAARRAVRMALRLNPGIVRRRGFLRLLLGVHGGNDAPESQRPGD